MRTICCANELKGCMAACSLAKNWITALSLPVRVLYCGYRPGLGRARQSNTKPPPLPELSVGQPRLYENDDTVTVSLGLAPTALSVSLSQMPFQTALSSGNATGNWWL